MTSGSEIFGVISGVFGILTVFSFVGGLLPHAKLKDLRDHLDEMRFVLEEIVAEGIMSDGTFSSWENTIRK